LRLAAHRVNVYLSIDQGVGEIDTRRAIMDAARSAVQARGYNALSFRELAKDVGVKSASVHYHFPTKGNLGAALARDYTEQGQRYLESLSTRASLPARMDGYVAIFRQALEDDNRMCLCGIMAAEQHDLPAEVRIEVDRFTDVNVAWLHTQLKDADPAVPADALEERALSYRAAGLIPG
jgi:TetR/AcrR family transcriptional repressor of nem operon